MSPRLPLPAARRFRRLTRGAAGLLIVALEASTAIGQVPDVVEVPPVMLDDTLEERRASQLATFADIESFAFFRFEERVSATGITFRHRIVDDAGRHYKAVHYDHGNGLAAADIDGDGLSDLYFSTQIGANELWRNLGGGRFENVTEAAGVGLGDRIGVSASFADVDNDGDADLYVTTVRMGNVLFENLGDGRFRDVSTDSGLDYSGHSSGAVFFDFDRDGRLDLFLANVGVYTTEETGDGGYFVGLDDAFSGHLFARRTERSLLFRNLGDLRFEEVSQSVGLLDDGWNGDAAFSDLDRDGFPELYVLNMQGDDRYWRNLNGARFEESADRVFGRTPWGAMGVGFFDLENDGDFDLLVTDMHSDMSEEVPPAEEKLKSTMTWTDEQLGGDRENIFGNALYRNRGDGTFVEVSDEMGAENYWPWGLSIADFNADGFEDIFITASMNYPWRYAINSLLLNEAGSRLVDAEFILGVEPRTADRVVVPWFRLDCSAEIEAGRPLCTDRSGPLQVMAAAGSRSSVVFDLDGDRDLDIVTNELNDRPQVLVSDLADQIEVHRLLIRLVGTSSNRDGLGARIEVRLQERTLHRFHDGRSGYLSQSSLPLWIGLGDIDGVGGVDGVETVLVAWPSGIEQTVDGATIDLHRPLIVVEPAR